MRRKPQKLPLFSWAAIGAILFSLVGFGAMLLQIKPLIEHTGVMPLAAAFGVFLVGGVWTLVRQLAQQDSDVSMGQRQQRLAFLVARNEALQQQLQERRREQEAMAETLRQTLHRQQEDQANLQESASELRAILQNANEAFIAIDEGGTIVEWNRQAEILLGWSRLEAFGQILSELIVPHHLRAAHCHGMQRFLAGKGSGNIVDNRVEIQALRRDGSLVSVELTVGHLMRREGHLFIAFLHDITERHEFRTSLEKLAMTDALTGLPNRRAFMEKLPDAMQRAIRHRDMMAVLFLDIDGFKTVNDRCGHEAGDELLRQFGRRVRNSIRETDSVARLAGDEFTVILENLQSETVALEIAGKILEAMHPPFLLDNTSLSLSSSIGVAMFNAEMQITADTLLNRADEAMYRAKREGKDRVVVSPALPVTAG